MSKLKSHPGGRLVLPGQRQVTRTERMNRIEHVAVQALGATRAIDVVLDAMLKALLNAGVIDAEAVREECLKAGLRVEFETVPDKAELAAVDSDALLAGSEERAPDASESTHD